MNITLTLLADGSSDRCLINPINWILNQHSGLKYSTEFAEYTAPIKNGLLARAQKAIEYYPCDILIVHRDAEGETYENRLKEIETNLSTLNKKFIPIIPIRMLEAWLLFDENAIRKAANKPAGNNALNIPRINRIENNADPKTLLFDSLKIASEQTGRKLAKFDVNKARVRVSELIDDYTPLLSLESFGKFKSQLDTCITHFCRVQN